MFSATMPGLNNAPSCALRGNSCQIDIPAVYTLTVYTVGVLFIVVHILSKKVSPCDPAEESTVGSA